MIYERIDIKGNTSLNDAHLMFYGLDASESILASSKRPLVIVCPGGAYAYTSDREAEPVAMSFLSAGFHAAVLRYSVAPATFPTALLELARSVKYLRENASRYHIDTDKIFVCGFSAGGHLAASYATMWSRSFVSEALGLKNNAILKPAGLLLGYPVITSGEYTHLDSMKNLLGADFETRRAEMALENQVNADTPPTFIWHTQTDGAVPVENSLYFAGALQRQGINYELHIYPTGCHGLSLSNEQTSASPTGADIEPSCQGWIELAVRWIKMQ